MTEDRSIAVIGLGYVGLPLAVALANRSISIIVTSISPAGSRP